MDTATLLWGLLFGSIGLGYVVYGRRQRAAVPFIAGLVLIAFPYFVSNSLALVAIGLVLIIAPFLLRGWL